MIAEIYQELFDHMSEQHGLTLLQGEMDDIISICQKFCTSSLLYLDRDVIGADEGIMSIDGVKIKFEEVDNISLIASAE